MAPELPKMLVFGLNKLFGNFTRRVVNVLRGGGIDLLKIKHLPFFYSFPKLDFSQNFSPNLSLDSSLN